MTTTQLRIKELTDQLITAETGLSLENDPENFNLCRSYAQTKFKSHTFGRTNQFDIASRLSGLEEKFYVKDAPELADALHSRLEELPETPLMPEILHLLLELSDRPVEKTRLSSLDKLVKPQEKRALTWADIIAEEPLEGEIWEDVDFGAESSDAWSGQEDEETSDLWGEGKAQKNKKRRKQRDEGDLGATEMEEEYRVAGVEGFLVAPDTQGLEDLKNAQYWEARVELKADQVDVSMATSEEMDDLWMISELQSLREVIFMLLGHPCALFHRLRTEKEGYHDLVQVDTSDASRRFVLRHASYGSFMAILQWFAEHGTNISRIRSFVRRNEVLAERQSFVAAVDEKLAGLDRELIGIEEGYVGCGSSKTVSLLSLQTSLAGILRPFASLSAVIASLSSTPADKPSHLEALFRSACYLQSTNDIKSFTFIATIFFSCLRTYLRPIRAWMESGMLLSTDFLVEQILPASTVALYPSKLWHDSYRLRLNHAPAFVAPFANRIFTTGKSVVFLHRLVPSTTSSDAFHPSSSADDLTFSKVCPNPSTLAPFSDAFATAFSTWISRRHHSVSNTLRNLLFTSCGLSRSLVALEYIYLCTNGFVFETLAAALFDRIDRRVVGWTDRFLLTELVQGIYSTTRPVDPSGLRMSASSPAGAQARSVQALAKIELDYTLPWPVANVLRGDVLAVYKRVWVLLLQVRRARGVLERLHLLALHEHPPVFYRLRQQLLWLANTLWAYFTTLIIAPQTAAFRQQLAQAQDVDAMVECLGEHAERLREMCLLGAKMAPIMTAVVAVLNVAVRFSDVVLVDLVGESGLAVAHLAERARKGDGSTSGGRTSPAFSMGTGTGTGTRGADGSGAEEEEEDDDDDESDSDEEEEEQALPEALAAMEAEFRGLVGFVKDGLRGVARAGVMPWLEWLAEGLEGGGSWGR